MQLIRRWDINSHHKNIHLGPMAGGIFLAAKDANDMSYVNKKVSYHELSFLMKTGQVFIHDAEKNDEWQEIAQNTLPKFSSKYVYREFGQELIFLPYLPEFYYVPTSGRGRRHLGRSATKATKARRQ